MPRQLRQPVPSYGGVLGPGLNACNQNSYCQNIVDGNLQPHNKFNTKIARYARPPSVQNASDMVLEPDGDTFGLGARTIGRPLRYLGTEAAPAPVMENLGANNIQGLCLPGRDPTFNFLGAMHSTEPQPIYQGDKVTNIGMAKASPNIDRGQLNSCSIFNNNGEFAHTDASLSAGPFANFDTANSQALSILAGTQAMSTNLLSIFEALPGVDLLRSFMGDEIVTNASLQQNRCLRAPGSVCFSDLDCGNSKFVRDRLLSVRADDTPLSEFELNFFKEYSICGQKAPKGSPNYDPTQNRCCRETGKELTIATAFNTPGANQAVNILDQNQNSLAINAVAGIDIPINHPKRYSRVATGYDLTNAPPNNATFPHLLVPQKDSCGNNAPGFACKHADTGIPGNNNLKLDLQWKTFDLYAKRSCCSGNWIREFSAENGGGHSWQANKMQAFNKANLQCLNWSIDPTPPNNFTCRAPNDPDCHIRNVTQTEADRVNNFLGLFELTGVPQIMIPSDDQGLQFQPAICPVQPPNRGAQAGGDNSALGARFVIPGTIIEKQTQNLAEYQATSGPVNVLTSQAHYSAFDMDNFAPSVKQVFDTTKVACCLPAGETVDASVTSDMCCTGFKSNASNSCCLPDYTNLSVYLNRYISSEANDQPDSMFNPATGFLRSPALTAQIALQKGLCCSGEVATGVAYSDLKIPGLPNNQQTVKRFVSSDRAEDKVGAVADRFNLGQRWNTHVYCVPSSNN